MQRTLFPVVGVLAFSSNQTRAISSLAFRVKRSYNLILSCSVGCPSRVRFIGGEPMPFQER